MRRQYVPPSAAPDSSDGRAAFRCEGDQLGHAAVGFHDGVDSWTLALEGGQTPDVQAFVALHERAHHRLHSVTPWGLAMLLTGLPGPHGSPAEEAWTDLVRRCRTVHEQYATWVAVNQARDGLEYLRGNLAYLSHYGRSRQLTEMVGDPEQPHVAVEILSLAVMAPADLTRLDLADVRARGAMTVPGPDQLLKHIVAGLTGDMPSRRVLRDVLAQTPDDGLATSSDPYWDEICRVLEQLGVESTTAAQQRAWSRSMVGELDAMWERAGVENRRRVLLEDATAPVDQLTALVDTHQRERLRMHVQPLELRVAELATSKLSDFARRGEAGQPFVVLSWLHTGFLRRHFAGADWQGVTHDALTCCLLSMDRRGEPGHAMMLPIPDSPAEASAVLTANLETVRFTTLRTMAVTASLVDFRGWDPAFVLVDSDVLAFLQRTMSDAGGVVWTAIDVAVDRHVDVLLVRRNASPGQVFLIACSRPTGRMIGAWMNERVEFTQEAAAFGDVRAQAFDLLQILVSTLWTFDLHGWDR